MTQELPPEQQQNQPPDPEETLRLARMQTRKLQRANKVKLAAGIATGAGGFLPGMAIHHDWFGAQEKLAPITEKIGGVVDRITPEALDKVVNLENLVATPEALGGTLQTAGIVGLVAMLGTQFWSAAQKRKQHEAMNAVNGELLKQNQETVQQIQQQYQTGQIDQTQANEALQEEVGLISPEQPEQMEEGIVGKASKVMGKTSLSLLGLNLATKLQPVQQVLGSMGVADVAALSTGMGQLSIALLAPVMMHSTYKTVKTFLSERNAHKIEQEKIDRAYDRIEQYKYSNPTTPEQQAEITQMPIESIEQQEQTGRQNRPGLLSRLPRPEITYPAYTTVRPAYAA